MEQSEQPDVKSAEDSSLKSLDDFRALPLDKMESELSSKNYSTYKEQSKDDQSQQDSETSEDASETDETSKDQTENQKSEQASEDESEKSEDSSESEQSSDNQKKDQSNDSKKDSKFDYEKAYKELQAEFTRRSQKIKDLEERLDTIKSQSDKVTNKEDEGDKKPSRLAQLRKKDPEAAALLEEIIQEQVESRIQDRIRPVEEQVTLRTRRENANKFAQAISEFQKSELAPLETELLAIYNENPDKWQRIIWDSEDAFEQLKKELIYKHLDKVADLKAKKVKESQSSTMKKERLEKSQVGTKTKVTNPPKDVVSVDDFKRLSLEEMEKRLPKYKN